MRIQHYVSAAILLGTGVISVAPAQAQTTFFSSGFETTEGYSSTISGPIKIVGGGGQSTTFDRAPGALIGQPSSAPYTYSFFNDVTNSTLSYADGTRQAVNSSTVVNTVAATGSQSLRIDGATLGDQRIAYLPDISFNAASNGVLDISADVRVTNPSATNFGQWGVEALGFNGTSYATFAAFGTSAGYVLATNDSGAAVYAAIDPNTFHPLTANYGSFNNYRMRLDYSTRTIQGLFNNSAVAFLPIDPTTFTPIGQPVAALSLTSAYANRIDNVAFGQEKRNATETGYFDNFRIAGSNVAVVPEPGSFVLALPALGLIGIILSRRKTK